MRSNSIDEPLPIGEDVLPELDPDALNSLDHCEASFDEGERLIEEWGWY